MPVKIKWLELTAFRSFVETSHIDFPSSGQVLIRGSNPVTHDSSGAGKSTVLLGISYALDMCQYSATELQSWLTEEPMQVVLCLDTDAGEVVVNRGKKNSVKLPDKTVTGAKSIADALRNILRLDPDTLRAVTYRPQDSHGLFLSLTDAGKKEFLSGLLGLQAIENAVEAADESSKKLGLLVDSDTSSAREISATLSALQTQLASLPVLQQVPPSTEGARLQVENLDAQIAQAWARSEEAKATAELDPDLARMRATLRAAQQYKQSLVQANAAKKKAFADAQGLVRRQIQDLVRLEAESAEAARTIRANETQITRLQQGECSQCLRPWDQAQTQRQKLESANTALRAQIGASTAKLAARAALEVQAKEVFVDDPTIERFSASLVVAEQALRAKVLELNTGPVIEAQEVVAKLKQERAELAAQVNATEQQIRSAQEINARLQKSRAVAEANIKASQERLQACLDRAAASKAQMEAELDFALLLGPRGFLGSIFEEVLAEIEAEANGYLARLANVSHVSVHFASEAVTQKGVVNKTIVTTVRVNGKEGKWKSALSGGMQTALEGVVDLAVSAVIQRRSGAMPGWLMCDETTNGMGVASKEGLLEIWNEYSKDRLILVVDHSADVSETFDTVINVVYNDGRSSIHQ